MTDFNKDYLDSNPKWDEKEEAVEGGGKTKFAKMRMYYPLHVNRFKTGEFFTLPDVFYDEFDEDTKISTRIGIKEFRGMTLAKSGKYHMALVVLEMQNKHQQWYQKQIQFGNWKDKDEDTKELLGCAWLEFQKAEMEKLSPSDRNAPVQAAKDNSWTFIQYNEADTGYEGTYEIKKYLTDIVVFKNEKEWQVAQAEFQAQFSESDASANSHYPADWYDSTKSPPVTPESVISWAREPSQDALKVDVLAKRLQLSTSLTPGGKKVDVDAIMAEIRPPVEESKIPF